MKLFYTGAEYLDAIQTSSDRSLGGYKSVTQIPNGALNVLFTNISYQTLQKKIPEVRALILKNTSGSLAINITLYTEIISAVPFSKIEVAPVTVGADGLMEKIMTGKSSPYDIDQWYELDGAGNAAIIIDELADGEYLGLWIRRTVRDDVDIAAIPKDELESYYDTISANEQMRMNFSWD